VPLSMNDSGHPYLRTGTDARTRFVFLVGMLVGLGLLVRLIWISVHEPPPLPRPPTIVLRFHVQRGEILDRNGIPLAANRGVLHLYRWRVDSTQRMLRGLGLRTLPGGRHAHELRYWGYVPPTMESRLHGVRGIRVRYGFVRTLIHDEAYSPLIGMVRQLEDGQDSGISGLELLLDSLLRGIPGREEFYLRTGRQIRELVPTGSRFPGQPGHTVTLTLDAALQSYAYDRLRTYVDSLQANAGAVVVLNPHTGEILAWVEAPPRPGMFRFLTAPFEPGSVFKLGVYLLARQKGLDFQESFETGRGVWRIQRHTFRDHKPLGRITLWEGFTRSSNIVTARIAFRLGVRNLYQTLRSLGFGAPTGVAYPAENPGRIPPPATWDSLRTASIAIGQGLLVNVLQIPLAYAAVASDGWLRSPRLILAVGEDTLPSPPPVRRIASREDLVFLRALLQDAVDHGTGKRARIPGVPVAGKTGTAQKYDPELGRYAPGRYLVSFVGFLPAEQPRYVIYVMLDEPRTPIRTGGWLAAPLFRDIGTWILDRDQWQTLVSSP